MMRRRAKVLQPQVQKAIEEVQWVAHMALVRVQTRNDDEA